MTSIPIDLKNKALETPKTNAAVVCPNEESVLLAVIEAKEINLINPILIGKKSLIEKTANQVNLEINSYDIIEINNEEEAATVACKLAHEDKVKIIIKGNLHTDILMRYYLKKEFNLIVGRRLSHIWHMTAQKLNKPLFLTDGA